MKYVSTKIIMIALVGGLIATGCNNKPVDLKLNLEKGKSYSYSMSTEESTEQKGMGQESKMSQSMFFGYVMKVEDVDTANNQTVDVKYDRIKMSQASDKLNLNFDSQQPASADTGMTAMVAKNFRPLVGNGFTMLIQPDGKVKSVVSSDALLDGILANMTEGNTITPDTLAMMREQLSLQINEFVKANMEPGFGFYPGKPVKKGDTWNTTQNIPGGLPLVVSTTYTLEKISGKKAFVNIDAVIKIDSTQQTMGEMTIDGKETGKLEIDVASGLINSGSLNRTLDMKMSGMGMEITSNSTTKTTIEGKLK